jgi:predicted nuclease of predicted toxin-antitoxin system
MKFHADEHVPEAIVRGLRRRGFDATTTNEAALIGANDHKQLAFCLRYGRVMVTHDADMLRLAASGTPHAGAAYCHNQNTRLVSFFPNF